MTMPDSQVQEEVRGVGAHAPAPPAMGSRSLAAY